MKSKNCPNCAAPYETYKNKCPYCGTSYYDMSALDFTNNEPFYLKIKTDFNGQSVYITQLVVPSLSAMELSSDTTRFYSGIGHMFSYQKCNTTNLTTNIEFKAIEDQHGNLMIIEKEDE